MYFNMYVNKYILIKLTMSFTTADQVRSVIERSGISIAEWARFNGFSTGLVYQILEGRRKCMRGQSYRIAVALGLQTGQPMAVKDLNLQLQGLGEAQRASEGGAM